MDDAQPISGLAGRVDLASEAAFSLGAARVRPASLEVAAADRSQILQPRVMQVLVALARRQGEVVSRDELVTRCWEGLSVSEDAINRCIAALRKLAAENDSPFAIETIPRVGYRLTASSAAPAGAGSASVAPATTVSIAVLPFANLSSDPRQEYFSDGITEDILTDLARWPSLAVASKNSTFRFKGQHIGARQVGGELGVRFVVEGSVRRLGERIRIAVQLVDSETGKEVWAERYDRQIDELFAVQDDVVRTLVGTLVGRVQASEVERLKRKPPSSLTAYDLTLRGNALPSSSDPAAAAEARQCFEQAIALDANYALPHSLLALALRNEWWVDPSRPPEIFDRSFVLAKRGVELADNLSTAHVALGGCYLDRRSFDLAEHHFERAIALNPANPWLQVDYAGLLMTTGRAQEALDRLHRARRDDPYFGPGWYWHSVAHANFQLRRYADAIADMERGGPNPPYFIFGTMAACWAKLGDMDRARALLARYLALAPSDTIGKILAKTPLTRAEDREHLAEALRLAGMPE